MFYLNLVKFKQQKQKHINSGAEMRIENKSSCSGYNRKNSELLDIYEYILEKFPPILFLSLSENKK